MTNFRTRMMPGQEPYTPSEWERVQGMIRDAALADSEFTSEELEEHAAKLKHASLDRLRVKAGEGASQEAINAAELAAWSVGASPTDTEQAIKQGSEVFAKSLASAHWVYGSGMVGCLFDNGPHLATSLEDAIDGALSPFLDCEPCLTEEQEARARIELRAMGQHYLPNGLGADYCEVSECRCSDPSCHGED